MKEKTMPWSDRLGSFLPSRVGLSAHPWLRPVARRLLDPQLWRLQHEAVARGVAVGTFWAFTIPAAQVVVAAAHCTVWRANVPVAAAMTLLTNPLTIAFWLWLAYQAGAFVLGEPVADSAPSAEGALAWIQAFGLPTLLGMGLFAVGGATCGYVCVKVFWRLRVVIKRRARQRSGNRRSALPTAARQSQATGDHPPPLN